MYIYNHIFTDEAMDGKVASVVRKIRMNAGLLDIFLICLAGGNDNFDIIDAKQLKQKGYPKQNLYIMGIAKGKESATQLATAMYLHFYELYGDIHFKPEIERNKESLFRRK